MRGFRGPVQRDELDGAMAPGGQQETEGADGSWARGPEACVREKPMGSTESDPPGVGRTAAAS